jgi:ribosomal protein S18 acetylase RimI-like enzyme
MEMANRERPAVRVANSGDKRAIIRLIRGAPFCHIHADWRLPVDWLGWPEFLLYEGNDKDGDLVACLAATADPLPAAWVRIAAAADGQEAAGLFETLIEAVLPVLAGIGVRQLGWLLAQPWPESWITSMGFEQVNAITTYVLSDLSAQPAVSNEVLIRPVEMADMATLAIIEEEAFEPLWRHSAEGLALAYHQATAFEVAMVDGEVAGFQYSVRGDSEHDHEHLARLTVRPAAQGLGVGSALLNAGLDGYRQRGVSRLSLNTQLDNLASHRLYRRFGFQAVGDELPVWAMPVS